MKRAVFSHAAVCVAVAAGCARPPAKHVDDTPPAEDPVVIDPACTADGCVRALEDLGEFPRSALTPYLAPGVVIDNGYRVFTIEFATSGASSTATLTLPVDFDEAPADGFPVVVNAHGTVGLDDPCRISSTISGAGLAGLFGARGAIGVAPDYPGLGTPGVQRYLDADSEGTSVLDAIRAALNVARHEGVATNGRAAVVGLSQGGHAVLAAAARHASYAPELDIRAFGACGPADMYEEQWAPGLTVSGAHIPNVALAVWSFAEQRGASTDGVFVDALAGDVDDLMHDRCMWSPSFTTEPTLPDAVSAVPTEVFTQPFIDAFSSGQLTSTSFAFVHDQFEEHRVRPFEGQTAPIRIWQGTADETVLPYMTEALVDDLQAAGMDVELTEIAGGTHIDTAFGFLASHELATDESVAWIKAKLAE